METKQDTAGPRAEASRLGRAGRTLGVWHAATALVAFAVCFALTAAPARADVIYREGAGRLVGKIVAEDEDAVTIETDGGRIRVSWDEIDRIERGPVPQPGAAKARARTKAPPGSPAKKGPPAKGSSTPRKTAATQKPAATSGPRLAPVSAALEDLRRLVRGATGPAREDALRRLAGTAAGRAVLVEELKVRADRAERRLRGWFTSRRAKLRSALREAVRVRRKEAYGFIMDPQRYPDQDHGRAAQPEVDRLVGLLERAYRHAYAELRAKVEAVRTREAALRAALDEAKRYLGPEGLAAVGGAARLERVAADVDAKLALRGVPVDEVERQVLEESARALRYNARVQTSAGKEERACIEATNRYRMMFGLMALRIDERLMRAARGHSHDMVERGFFDHTSPVPGKRSPEDRCRKEGATFAAENIAMGNPTGEGAFHQWYTSSGHHRNILTKGPRTIGIGRFKTHWTQNFGSDILR